MKTTISIIAFGLLTSLGAQANGANIAERKAKVSAHIDSKIALLGELKVCVNGASAKGDIKKCRTTHKEKMKTLRAQFKASRKNK